MLATGLCDTAFKMALLQAADRLSFKLIPSSSFAMPSHILLIPAAEMVLSTSGAVRKIDACGQDSGAKFSGLCINKTVVVLKHTPASSKTISDSSPAVEKGGHGVSISFRPISASSSTGFMNGTGSE